MPTKRIFLELGAGNALHDGDYTKAAIRAVNQAIHHSALLMVRTLGRDVDELEVIVTIGVQHPERVDAEAVKATLPEGKVTVRVVPGGLDVTDAESGHHAVIASAAVEVRLDLP